MNEEIDQLISQLKKLEIQIEDAIDAKSEQFFKDLKNGKAQFDEATLSAHRAVKTGINKYIFKSNLATLLTIPFVYGMMIPFIILDLGLFIYQATCFTAWQIPKVKRADFIVIDRQFLAYLNVVEKINCMFCGYGNGLLAYGREIASLTEQYWCPIKHAKKAAGQHQRYKDFLAYGDADGFKKSSEQFRDKLRKLS
jgi:hypothetical protein